MANDTNNTPQNNQENPEPTVLIPEKPTTGDVKVIRTRKTPKPLVEGINTPVAGTTPAAPVVTTSPEPSLMSEAPSVSSNVISPKVTLTEAEKVLVSNNPVLPAQNSPSPVVSKQAIFPENFTGKKIILPTKKTFSSKLVWGVLISLLIVSLVFGALLWYDNQTGSDISQLWGSVTKPVEQNANSTPVVDNNPKLPVATTSPVIVVTPTASSTASSTPPATVQKTMQVQVKSTPTDYLNVRNAPSINGKLLTRVHPGETYTFTEAKNGWYLIVLTDGTSGWVTGQYVKVLSPAK